jgi:hypothetical protein
MQVSNSDVEDEAEQVFKAPAKSASHQASTEQRVEA